MVNILGYLFTPDVNLANPSLSSHTQDYIRKNGYAALKELDYWMNISERGERFKQKYRDALTVNSPMPPFNLCHLISATNTEGKQLENAYDYSMNVTAENITNFMASEERHSGEEFAIHDYISNINTNIAQMPKPYSANYKYNIIGASSAVLPIEEITTYMAFRLFKKIEKMMDGEYYLGGQAAVSNDTQNTTSREMTYYSIAAVIIITIILLMSTSSYLEPLLFFAAIGVAIIINMGTNLIFGRVSSMTFSVASIIQLAVSMDYSIFLLHRYHEESQYSDEKSAMIRAIEKTFSSVSASALTTVAGFLALVIMKYGIGKDMGLVLAKGVFLSLISVITLLPCLVLIADRRFSKHKHKILLPSFNKSSKWIVKFRYIAIVLVALIAIPVFLGQTKLKYYYSNEKTLSEDKKAVVANKKINEVFDKNNELIVIVPISEKAKINGLVKDIKAINNVSSVEGLYTMADRAIPESFVPESVRKTFLSNEYTYFLAGIESDTEGEVTKGTIESIKKVLENNYNKFYITGEAAIYLDLQSVTSSDFNNVNIVSIILIGLILLLTFKSITLSIILVFVIQLGIWINLSIPYFQGEVINFISFIVIGAIQLGATVDYAILFTSRYRENLDELTPPEAMEKTISDTGRSVLTSVLILAAGTFSVYFITTIKSAAEITLLIGRGAIISLILVYVLLPAMLLIFGRVIGSTTAGWPRAIKIENSKGCEK
jgi:predicted RND superfamily exporter protein